MSLGSIKHVITRDDPAFSQYNVSLKMIQYWIRSQRNADFSCWSNAPLILAVEPDLWKGWRGACSGLELSCNFCEYSSWRCFWLLRELGFHHNAADNFCGKSVPQPKKKHHNNFYLRNWKIITLALKQH